MSQLGGPNSQNIGGVHFTVGVAGAEQASAQVDKTAASVQNLGTAAQQAAPKIDAAAGSESGGGVKGFVAGLKSATKPFRESFNLFSSFIGIATRLVGVLGLAIGALASMGAGIKALNDWLHDTEKKTDDAVEALRAYAKELERIQKATDGLGKGGINVEAIDTAKEAMDRLTAATKEMIEVREASDVMPGDAVYIIDKAARAKYEALQAEIESLKRTIDLIHEKAAAEKELHDARTKQHKELEEHDKRMADLQKEIDDANKEAADKDAKEWEKKRKREQEHMEKEAEFVEWVNKEKEKAREKELEHAKKMADEMQDFREEQSKLFNGSNLATSLAQMVDTLERLNAKSGGKF